MGVETEKKYRVSSEERERLLRRLAEAGATREGEDFETNTIYRGDRLDPARDVLRLRRTNRKATFTYKRRGQIADASDPRAASGIRSQREDETEVSDADALASILDALGYAPAVVYEKRRVTWRLGGVEIVVDELPFGLFVEIEGTEQGIGEAERALGLTDAEGVGETYPELTERHGRRDGGLVAARFG